eukprot:906894-Pyramimonas_sp.AAC.1
MSNEKPTRRPADASARLRPPVPEKSSKKTFADSGSRACPASADAERPPTLRSRAVSARSARRPAGLDRLEDGGEDVGGLVLALCRL